LRTSVLWLDNGSGPEASPSWVSGELLAGLRTHQASYKTDWEANEEAVVIKCAVPYTTGARDNPFCWGTALPLHWKCSLA